MEVSFAGKNEKDNDVVGTLYESGVFYNWGPVFLRAQLSAVATNLKNLTIPWDYGAIKATNLTETLSNDTLYVPRTVLMDFNAFSGKEKEKSKSIFDKYKFKYRICSPEELYQIFETEKRGRLLFEYVKSSTDKFVTVYDVKEKTIIYRRYSPISYNLKAKDIAAIK